MRRVAIVGWLVVAGCLDLELGPEDFAAPDAGVVLDRDAGFRDAGPLPHDAGFVLDASVGRDGGAHDSGGRDGGVGPYFLRRIDVDTTGVSETLTNFPLPVEVNPARIEYADARADGSDIRFLASDGVTVLAHEIASWTPGGASYVWVQLDVLPQGLPTFFFMEYGNEARAPSTPSDYAATWSEGYTTVLHFENAGLQRSDVPGSAVVGSGTGLTAGRVGDAISIGAGGVVELPPTAIRTDVGTACVWVRPAPTTPFDYRFVLYGASAPGGDGFGPEQELHLGIDGIDGSPHFFMRADSAPQDIDLALRSSDTVDGAWHQLCASWNVGGDVWLRFNDTDGVGTPREGQIFAASILQLGRSGSATRTFDGDVDELRLSNVERSDAWVSFAYLSAATNRLTFGPAMEIRP